MGGPPAGISFSGGLAKTTGTTETAGLVAGVACAPDHWLDRRYWDNGRLARCVGGPLTVHATRKMRVVPVRARCALSQCAQDARCPSWPIPCAKRQAGAILGGLDILVVLAEGARARSGQVPAPPSARRQDGGAPSQSAFPMRSQQVATLPVSSGAVAC